MNVLISGASGFIGSAFIEKYHNEFNKIFTIGRASNEEFENIPFDMCSSESLKLPEVDLFFHFAAQTSAGIALEDPIKDFQINALSTLKIFEQFRVQKIFPSIVLASSVTQKGFTEKPPLQPSLLNDDPICFYSLSKLIAEKYLRLYSYHNFCRGVSLRIANAFGRSQNYGNQDRGVIDKALLKSLNGEGLEVWGSGKYIRDYIFVEDIIDAFWLAGKNISKINSRNFDVGTGNGITVLEAFETVRKVAQEQISKTLPKVIIRDDISIQMEMDKRSYIAEISEFSDLTGWKPKFNLESDLRQMTRSI